MSLSPIETKFLEIRSYPENRRNSMFSFEMAMRVNVTNLLGEQIKFYGPNNKGSVINIYGSNKSGRTTVAKSLTTLIERERDSKLEKKLLELKKEPDKRDPKLELFTCVTFNFLTAFEEIEKEDIIIIEQGEKFKTHKEKADAFGLEQIINACNNKNAVALIVSDKKLMQDNIQADYYLKCEAIDKEKQVNYCILEINKYNVGFVEILKLYNSVIEESYLLAHDEFMKSEVQRILENIDETTKEVLKRWRKHKNIIFAEDPKDIDPEDPAIMFIPVIILGGQGEGKSTLSKILVYDLSEYYGVHSVHSLRHERDLTGMIQNGFSSDPKKYIQIFVATDFTFTKAGLGDLQEYSKIRHYMCDKAGIKQGEAIPIMCLHYLTGKGSDVSYRNLVSFMFVLNPSDHIYTRENILSKLMPESHLKFLDYIVNLREQAELDGNAEEFLRLKGFGVCIIKGVSYPFYFNRKDYPIAHIESYESCPIVLADNKQQIHIRAVDDEFLQDLRIGLASYLNRFTKNVDHIQWYLDYYANDETLTHLDIAERYELPNEDNRGRDAVGKAIKRLKDKIYSEDSQLTGLGRVLELVLEKNFQSRQQNITSGSGKGGSKQPDLYLEEKDLAINCKFRHRPEGTYVNMECTPENKCTNCWIAIYDRKYGLMFHNNKENKAYETFTSKEGINIKQFIKKISDGEP